MSEPIDHAKRLRSLVPNGDGYYSEWAEILSEAADYIERISPMNDRDKALQNWANKCARHGHDWWSSYSVEDQVEFIADMLFDLVEVLEMNPDQPDE